MKVSPDSSFARFTRRPFTSIPFVESRSTIQYVGALLPQLGMAARDVRVLDLDVALPRAAEDDAALVDAQRPAVPREHRDLALDTELAGDAASVACGGAFGL